MAALDIIRFVFRLRDVDDTNIADGRVLVARPDVTQPSGFVHEYEDQAGGGGGPPTGPAGGALDGTYPNPGIAATVAGAGLAEAADVLSVNVDNSSIEINADTLRVKASGVTEAMLAFDPATQAELNAAIANAVNDGDAAGGVLSGTYPNPGFAADMATQAELDAHINDPTDAHAGTAIGNTPAGGVAATTVQGAINELDLEKVATTTFDDHSARHENGGADEISVAGLSGELADAQPVAIHKNGTIVGTRSNVNFIEGTNVTLTIADDAGDDEVDVTIAASGASDGWTYVVKQADQSETGTAVQNDDELFFTATNGVTYEIRVGILYSNAAGSAPDLKTDWGEDSTARGVLGGPGVSNTDASFTVSVITNQTNTAIFGTLVARRQAFLSGIHEGAGGTFRMRWCQNTNNATATVVHADSFIAYREVA